MSARLAVDVVQLVRVCLDVVQLPVVDVCIIGEVVDRLQGIEAVVLSCAWLSLILIFYHSSFSTLAIEVNQLVAFGANTIMLAYKMICRIVVVVIV